MLTRKKKRYYIYILKIYTQPKLISYQPVYFCGECVTHYYTLCSILSRKIKSKTNIIISVSARFYTKRAATKCATH